MERSYKLRSLCIVWSRYDSFGVNEKKHNSLGRVVATICQLDRPYFQRGQFRARDHPSNHSDVKAVALYVCVRKTADNGITEREWITEIPRMQNLTII